MEETAKRPRKWLWISLATLVAVAVLLATYAALNRGQYAFLERWRPRHVEINLMKGVPAGAMPKGRPIPRMLMLVFADKDSAAILAALKRELTPARGYLADDLGKMFKSTSGLPPGYGNSEMWMFYRAGATTRGGEAVSYASGFMGGEMARLYENGLQSRTGAKRAQPACIVLVMGADNWLQRQLSALRRLLHVG
jgi:hypothetical protein